MLFHWLSASNLEVLCYAAVMMTTERAEARGWCNVMFTNWKTASAKLATWQRSLGLHALTALTCSHCIV